MSYPPQGQWEMPVTGPGGHSRPPRRRGKTVLLAAGVTAVVLIALGAGVVLGSHHGTGSASTSPSPSRTPRPASPAAASLSADGQEYASDMRTVFSFGTSVTDSAIASFGQQVCSSLEDNFPLASEVPDARQSWSNTSPGDAIKMILLAEKNLCPSRLAPQKITYIITGTPGADVTYGPSGSDLTGTVPMTVTAPLRHPSYYAINAQLQGAGQVTCKLKVDGVTLSRASAAGGFNIADCEIGQDPITGTWEDDNS